MTLTPLGDRAWLARFDTEDSARAWAAAAREAGLMGVTDVVLAYRSVAVHADPELGNLDAIEHALTRIEPSDVSQEAGRLIVIPVLYDGEDLDEVATMTGLTDESVIALHSGQIYDVFAIGFQPGFPYLGYLPPPLDRVPRRATPRVRVPAGSVAIAARQTGIYPTELPGGWQLIGRTPLVIVDTTEGREHFPIRSGDRIQFEPIDSATFEGRRGEIL